MKFSLTPDYTMTVFSCIAHIQKDDWQSIKKDMQFYQSYNFLQIIEALHPELRMRYAFIYKQEKLFGIVYTQQMEFSYRQVFTYSESKENIFIRTIKKYLSGKQVYLLNLGDVFFTGDKGILSENESDLLPLMPEILNQINNTFTENRSGAFLMANITLSDESKCVFYKSQKYHPFITEPDMYMHIRDEWHSFQDYLNALSAKYRTRAKKVMSTASPIICRALIDEEALLYKNDMAQLYANVMDKTSFNLARLNPDFFIRVRQEYPNNCTLKGYFLEGKMVAFVCLFACNDKQLHIHYIGLNYEVNAQYKLYNRMLFDFLQYAIENGFDKIHFGRTATEIKSTVGAQALQLQAYLKLKNRLMNLILPDMLEKIKPQPYTLRNPFK
ncbi:MAG TPA: GNAT family N-acetyltransferase [Chitinophagales bacterium]|nr:GNAT family N-acetyltransferase [Chitinophagales bacterium]